MKMDVLPRSEYCIIPFFEFYFCATYSIKFIQNCKNQWTVLEQQFDWLFF